MISNTTFRIFGFAAIALGLLSCGSALADTPVVGSAAPGLKLQDQHGDWHTLEQYKGQWVALYFYPKDATPGCTTEACSFRDHIFAFRDRDAVILGISLDDVASHEEFAREHSLPFSLLADADHEVSEQYGVVRNLGLIKFAKRQTFLIAPDGTIAKHYEKVDPESHSTEILADLKAFQTKDQESSD
jgi:peroxiredoxin Q/BCP